MRKRVIQIAVLLIVALLAVRIVFLIVKSVGGEKRLQRPPVAVEVDSVRFGPIEEIRQFTGSVSPQYRYIVAPKVSGRIIEIRKRIGDPVKRGEVVARIDDAEYQQAVREAEASLKSAIASLAEAQSQYALAAQDLERVQSLQQKGIASASELDAAVSGNDAAQSRLNLARAQVEQREAALKSAEIRLSYAILTAPEPGFTGERFADEGSLLAPNSPVISVVGIDRVIIKTTIVERDYGSLRTGQQAEVEVDAFPSRKFSGRVARIAPMLQQASRMAEMEIEVANESLALKPGMFARVSIVLADKKRTRIVPSLAVVNREGTKGVFAIDPAGAIAHFIPIETGIVTPEMTEILKPEVTGLVATLGQHLLSEGSPVILPRTQGEQSSSPASK